MYGCFRCGAKLDEDDLVPDDDVYLGVCPECGEDSVMSVTSAMDIINDLYLKGLYDPLVGRESVEEITFEE